MMTSFPMMFFLSLIHIYLAQELWAQLWEIYRQRVPYARIYETMIQDAGGIVANDHIAFRSLRLMVDRPSGSINLGVPYLEKIVERCV